MQRFEDVLFDIGGPGNSTDELDDIAGTTFSVNILMAAPFSWYN